MTRAGRARVRGAERGPQDKFSPAISMVANCDTQEEVDGLWQKLAEGETEVQCGWLTDKLGVSWQVVPGALIEMFSAPPRPC